MRKFLLGIASLAVIGIASCDKDKDFSRATVIDTGDITADSNAIDGCGYILRLPDGTEERPEYMPSAFQHNGLKVKVKFHSSGVLDTCRFLPPRKFYERVYIDDIKQDLD